ncbi:cation:proton antiporter [Corynebacterium godavarianum]|uniref:Cation:proton antiporter n=3 Tax=Corynebacterium TaxID=1716 RepID=A0ABY3E5A7_9CORY|nr:MULTISPECIES: cation:proton antiporter [Corynebacterium]MBL7284927.1 cation:proton antiporter [Corynebacterium godavarianum]PAT11841.1 cation:proton antiporter [Corynebacterium hadale]RMD18671.1 cation:proton antiporter [Corynebacterium gottingense]TSJ74865.1 cation:proton antiporter [Corynebacterium godavarianum]TVX78748.1 cation:proton antiporter [Corynebacterium sp. NML180780]
MFQTIMTVCIVIMALSLLAGLAKIIVTTDELSRSVLADLVFYAMVAIYLVWTLFNQSMITYEIAVLAALVCGVIPTISMARIISRGRR